MTELPLVFAIVAHLMWGPVGDTGVIYIQLPSGVVTERLCIDGDCWVPEDSRIEFKAWPKAIGEVCADIRLPDGSKQTLCSTPEGAFDS